MKDQVLDHNVDDLRLPYLEGLLSPEERSNFEDHLRKCTVCTSKLEEMSRWASVLKDNAREMCPDGWQLFDYVRSGKDTLGIMSSHLETCPSCLADAESFKAYTSKQGVPSDLWEKIERLRSEPSPRLGGERRPEWLVNLFESMKDLFRPAVLVPVAVAAMVVFLVVSYPGTPVRPSIVALSSVTWAPESDTLGLMSGEQPATSLPGDRSKEALAIAILLTNFRHPIDQDRIDSFYRALEPPLNIRDRYAIISPAEWRSAISKEQQRVSYNSALLAELRSKLGISRMLTVELIRDGETFSLRARLVDTTTENVVRERDDSKLTENELVSTLENISQSMLHN